MQGREALWAPERREPERVKRESFCFIPVVSPALSFLRGNKACGCSLATPALDRKRKVCGSNVCVCVRARTGV